jgi:hypothetical protein
MLTTMTTRSPLGTLRLYASANELVALSLPDRPGPPAVDGRSDVLVCAAAQLAEYFAGKRRAFGGRQARSESRGGCSEWS